MSCGAGHRRDSDPPLLWLWRSLAATAPIRPLAWEPPYAEGAVLKTHTHKKNPIVGAWAPVEVWVLSLLFLVSLARGLSILFTFSKNRLLV